MSNSLDHESAHSRLDQHCTILFIISISIIIIIIIHSRVSLEYLKLTFHGSATCIFILSVFILLK